MNDVIGETQGTYHRSVEFTLHVRQLTSTSDCLIEAIEDNREALDKLGLGKLLVVVEER